MASPDGRATIELDATAKAPGRPWCIFDIAVACVSAHDVGAGNHELEVPFVCNAIGDCCLFHVRCNELLRSFPIVTVEEFERDPVTLCSTNWQLGSVLTFSCMTDTAKVGDRLYLATDAFAKWAIQTIKRGDIVDWEWFERLKYEEWSEWVRRTRDSNTDRRMRVDDTTVICIEVRTDGDVFQEANALRRWVTQDITRVWSVSVTSGHCQPARRMRAARNL